MKHIFSSLTLFITLIAQSSYCYAVISENNDPATNHNITEYELSAKILSGQFKEVLHILRQPQLSININAQNEDGDTFLHMLYSTIPFCPIPESTYKDLIAVFKLRKFNPNLKNKNGLNVDEYREQQRKAGTQFKIINDSFRILQLHSLNSQTSSSQSKASIPFNLTTIDDIPSDLLTHFNAMPTNHNELQNKENNVIVHSTTQENSVLLTSPNNNSNSFYTSNQIQKLLSTETLENIEAKLKTIIPQNRYLLQLIYWVIITKDITAPNKRLSIVKIFLDLGADVNLKNKNGNTLLYAAYSTKHLALFKLLLEHGADYRLPNKNRQTMYEICNTNDENEPNHKKLKKQSFKFLIDNQIDKNFHQIRAQNSITTSTATTENLSPIFGNTLNQTNFQFSESTTFSHNPKLQNKPSYDVQIEVPFYNLIDNVSSEEEINIPFNLTTIDDIPSDLLTHFNAMPTNHNELQNKENNVIVHSTTQENSVLLTSPNNNSNSFYTSDQIQKLLSTETLENIEAKLKTIIPQNKHILKEVYWVITTKNRSVSKKRLSIVKIFLDLGADVNLKNKKGSTLLYAAYSAKHLALFKLLLDKGADYRLPNKNGQTMYEICNTNDENDSNHKKSVKQRFKLELDIKITELASQTLEQSLMSATPTIILDEQEPYASNELLLPSPNSSPEIPLQSNSYKRTIEATHENRLAKKPRVPYSEPAPNLMQQFSSPFQTTTQAHQITPIHNRIFNRPHTLNNNPQLRLENGNKSPASSTQIVKRIEQ